MKNDNEELNKFSLELVDLIEKYNEHLPPYEIVYRMICQGVSLSLCCAPNPLVGMKTVIASVADGIKEYEDNHKPKA